MVSDDRKLGTINTQMKISTLQTTAGISLSLSGSGGFQHNSVHDLHNQELYPLVSEDNQDQMDWHRR